MTEVSFRIQPCRPEDVEHLPRVELEASKVFPLEDVPAPMRDSATTVYELNAALREGRLFVAIATASERPIGFAHLGVFGNDAHLLEIDVVPEHARRGIGAALVQRAIDWARTKGFDGLTLSTFRHLPWNAPFYAKQGFEIVEARALTPPLAEQLRREIELGLSEKTRVGMRCVLSNAGSPGDAPLHWVTKPKFTPGALAELFAVSWPGGAVRDLGSILKKSLSFVAAYAGSRLIGFVNVAWDGGSHAFLLDPTVHPDFRRRGIGTRLVELAAANARDRNAEWLHVDFTPEYADFYRRAGFQPTQAGLMRL